ncbi:MAG: sigma-70 family RNA polymerase sigma factor [Desulforhopalus sp.]
MLINRNPKILKKPRNSPELIDLLATQPSPSPFSERVQELQLSKHLEQKVLQQQDRLPSRRCSLPPEPLLLTADDEKELGTEMLLLRHRFTELIINSRKFRQAAMTIIQNIYLFRNRKIFFGTNSLTPSEQERQEALQLFCAIPSRASITLAKTFQHLILARVWNRIVFCSTETDFQDPKFIELQAVVEKLNTIRNIYIMLTTGLVRKLACRINNIYKQSITYEDATQIGSFGIGRAAYRYHSSCGIRFSTFAANWVFKEIQRQSLEGRLVRLSTNSVEQYTKAIKNEDTENLAKFSEHITHAMTTGEETFHGETSAVAIQCSGNSSIVKNFESQETYENLLWAINQLPSAKSRDIIKRRYGFPPYQGREQSVIAISKEYGVTRGSIYQLEQAALKRLNQHLESERI